ncbi:MAG: DUF222 domain-containing protein [Acidimicrobiales bacterium]
MGELRKEAEASDDVVEEPVLGAEASALAGCTPAERSDAVCQLGGLMASVHAKVLDTIAAVDARRDWEADGAWAVVPWVVGQLGVSRRTAAEWVRVAHALQALPLLRRAYGEGSLSWDQVRPATRFVTPEEDQWAADTLPGLSASQIELMARQRRPIPTSEAADAHARRGLTFRRDHRRGGYSYRGFLPFDQGEAVNTALVRIAESMGPNAATGTYDPIQVRLADALHELATRRLGSASAPDRATVVIHADAAVLDDDHSGNGFLGDVAICRTGVMRALCDCRVEVAVHGPDGRTVGVARALQTIPWWLRRQVVHRDGRCRFPGCERHIRQVHHIQHWGKQGPTDLDNLVGLCWLHHHLVHEGGWRLEGDPDEQLTFVSPSKRRLRSRPQPLRPSIRARFDHLPGIGDGSGHPAEDPPGRAPPAA